MASGAITFAFICFLIWIIIGITHATYHISHYPKCCPYHPDLLQSLTNKGKISACSHYSHLFCRYVCNTFAILLLIPICIIVAIMWLLGALYYGLIHCVCCNTTDNVNTTEMMSLIASNPEQKKRVAVIGAGPSGLVTAKYLLTSGHDVVLFEKSDQIGGSFAWSYPGLLTTSSFITQFSDLNINEQDLLDESHDIKQKRIELGTFLTFQEYCNYLVRYSKVFDIHEHILFNSSVTSMRFNTDDKQWKLETDSAHKYTFDHVAICTGIACAPNMPAIMNQNGYKNNIEIIHSQSFLGESDTRIQDKNVLIIGCGESGSDISYVVSKVCNKYDKKCYISTRNGPGYIISRWYGGIPSDADTSRMYHKTRRWGLSAPIRFKRWMEGFWITPYDDTNVLRKAGEINKSMGIGPFQKYGTKSISFIRGVLYNELQNKPHIKQIDFVQRQIEFVDKTKMTDCDIIICCTGYKTEFAFFDQKTPIKVNELFQRMFDLHYGDTLCFIGLNRPFIGSLPPISEMSARYFALIVSDLKQLPSKEAMLESIALENELRSRQFPDIHDCMPTLCDFLTKYDVLSKLIGCDTVNNMSALFVFHPLIWYKVLTKTIQSVQFKLYGPNKSNDMKRMYETLSSPPSIPIPVLLIEFMVYVVFSIFAKQ